MKETLANRTASAFLPGVILLFVGSGCAALIYEVVWFQLLQLAIGLTNVSLGVLLATYMGGMCLGSLLLPRLVRPDHHPLRVYALLEIGIGVVGIALLFLIPSISRVYAEVVGRGLPGILLRAAVAALCLLPPTVLMGATLPAVARWVESSRKGVAWLGFFYGGNITGAVVGCLMAGFYLLRVHDVAIATFVAAGVNATVALIGLTIAFFSPARPRQSVAAEITPEPDAAELTGRTGLDRTSEIGAPSVYLAVALSGLTALGAEVVWTRLLSLILGGTVYTFSLILAVFLTGLGLGSTAGAYVARQCRQPRLALGICQWGLVLSIAWSAYAIAQSLPYWPINPALSLAPWFTFQLDLARCFWALLPAAICWGASFPLGLAAVPLRKDDAGRTVGAVYAANTVGAIVGAIGFSLLVIPEFGTRRAQVLLLGAAAVTATIACAPWLRRGLRDATGATAAAGTVQARPAARLSLPRAATLLTGLAIALVLGASVAPVPWGVAAYGRFMATYADRLIPGIQPDAPKSDSGKPSIYCNYLGEGMNGTVAVTTWSSGIRNFHSAGKVQASTEPSDMRLQRMLGHLSALAHPKPESVLVVACGAGVTAGTFVLHPSVKRIVICDIEPLVPLNVASFFEKENYGVVKDPRTALVFDDGRHFIRTTQEKFDIITSDPIDPWVKGCAALNTVEYYEACKAHLKPGGVMSLWIPLYESNSPAVKSLIATFFKVFPDGILWSNDKDGEGYDAVLFGRVEPSRFDLDEWQARLNRPDHAQVKKSLADVGFKSALSLLATYAGQACDLVPWTHDAQINTDRNLRLQYLAGLGANSYQGAEILSEITQYYRFPENLFVSASRRKQILELRLQSNVGRTALALPTDLPTADLDRLE